MLNDFEIDAINMLMKLSVDEVNEMRIKWQHAINEQDPDLYIRVKEYTDVICDVAISRINRKAGMLI